MLTFSDVLEGAGWRWKAALILLLAAAPASWLLLPSVAPWPTMALLVGATLLALSSTVSLLEQTLAPMAEAPPVGMAEPVAALSAILEGQRLQMHEAAAAVSRAVTAGAQLVSLARNAEQQWRHGLEQRESTRDNPSSTAALEAMRSSMTAAQGAAEASLQQRFGQMETRLESWAAALAAQMASATAMPVDLSGHLGRLESVSQSLALQAKSQAHHEASLGDAARYMTETADRLRDGVQAVETQAVRLQALLMAHRAVEEGPHPVPESCAPQEPLMEAPALGEMAPMLHGLMRHLQRPDTPSA